MLKKFLLLTLIAVLCICCQENNKTTPSSTENKPKPKLAEKKVPFDSIFVTDTVHLAGNIAKRFDRTYSGTTVFNDGSRFDITTSLEIGKPEDVSQTFLTTEDIKNALAKNTFDSAGVVTKDRTYHPKLIGNIALKAIDDYKITKSEQSKKVFFDQLKWIEDNFHKKEHYGFWVFPFSFPAYHLKSGWPSAFSQGLLLNVCLEAYKLTGKERYAVMMEKALKAYLVPVEYGGFMREWDKNELWYEEYPTKKPSRVWDGSIYGLEGVYNVYQDLGLELAKQIFDSGVETIEKHLEDFYIPYASRFEMADWKNQLAKTGYHEGYVIQLLWLYRVTGKEAFKKYAQLFLENDRHDFFQPGGRYYLKPKIKSIAASKTIDSVNYGVEHLFNNLWAYGKFWSSHVKTELVIELGQKEQNIHALTLYHVNDRSKDVNFTVYGYDEENGNWEYVEHFIPKTSKDKMSVYNKTGHYETYIEHFNIVQPLNAQKIKIVFEATNQNIIALREINFIFDRSDDLEHLIEVVDKRLEEGK